MKYRLRFRRSNFDEEVSLTFCIKVDDVQEINNPANYF